MTTSRLVFLLAQLSAAIAMELGVAAMAAAQEATIGGIFNGTRSVFPARVQDRAGPAGVPELARDVAADPQVGRAWEGLASTDYFRTESVTGGPPDPDIAVGPEDILTIAGRTIARYPNPNAAHFNNASGTAPVPYNPAGTLELAPTSRISLDTWLGEGAITELCPSLPRSPASCLIENASVRYDQMQGRFLVLFTVVDTGHVYTSGLGTPSAVSGLLRRKASWVLLVSRWATGCQGTVGVAGVNVGSACVTNLVPARFDATGNTEFFTTPQPPGPSQANPNSGGSNQNWMAYYGIVDGTCDSTCNFGSINSITDLRRGGVIAGARTIDCNNTAVGDGTRVCFLPTSARLGLDNDNIVIVSTVYDDNVPLAARTPVNASWQGSRVRVLKKAAIYTGLTSTPGSPSTPMTPGAAQLAPQLQGDFYDVFPLATPFTLDRAVQGSQYEPAHVRGRPQAFFNNRGGATGGFTMLVGTVSAAPGGAVQNTVRLQPITFTQTLTVDPAGAVNRPLISGGIPTFAAQVTASVPAYTNPNTVRQRGKLVQPSPNNVLPAPDLYVGDNRPHRVIMREGYVFTARVGQLPNTFNLDAAPQTSTVIYDAFQVFNSAFATPVFNLAWQNGRFFAPMFDVPAYTSQAGGTSPWLALPAKSVTSTFPPLPPGDPRLFSYGNVFGHALIACKGNEPTAVSSASSYPGLFDMRCGEDAFDTAVAFRNPVSNAFTPSDFQLQAQPPGVANQIYPFNIRGGAATDPNNLGSWLYGAYSKGRRAKTQGHAQWGTFVAFYPAVVPTQDLSSIPVAEYTDVPRSHVFFNYIEIGRLMLIDPASATATLFNPDNPASRLDMAIWTIRSLMDETGITAYLNSTGGIQCAFADIPCPGAIGGTVTNTTGVTTGWRYVETMYRRRITLGCQSAPTRLFCPTSTLTRGQMAAFLMRAKMGSVFPTVPGAAVATTSCVPPGQSTAQVADLFGLASGCQPYFSDVPNTDPFFAYIQKMFELRITNGITLATATSLGTYGPSDLLTRGQLMVFVVRAFFP